MNTEVVRNLTDAQLSVADIAITERGGDLVFTDQLTRREMDPDEPVQVYEADLGTHHGESVTAYVTRISVPDFGDGGVQRLHNHLKGPEPEPEA